MVITKDKSIKNIIPDAAKQKEFLDEQERFMSDIGKYGAAVNLWLPEYKILYNMLQSRQNDFSRYNQDMRPDMKQVFLDYTRLEETLQSKQSLLIEAEIKESIAKVFNRQEHPSAIFKRKNKIVEFHMEEMKKAGILLDKESTSLLDMLNDGLSTFISYMQNIVDAAEKIHNARNRLSELLSMKIEPDPVQLLEALKSIADIMPVALGFLSNLTRINELGPAMEKRVQVASSISKGMADEVLGKVNSLGLIFKEHYGEFVEEFVGAILELDSFNQHFVRFLARLVHIRDEGNRNYSTYERYDNREDRDELKDFLKSIKYQFPHLVSFLLEIYQFNDLRRIGAHSLPKSRISDDGTRIIIYQVDKPPLVKKIEVINKIINSYVYFVTGLKIFEEQSIKQDIEAGFDKISKIKRLGESVGKANELIKKMMKIKKEDLELPELPEFLKHINQNS